MVEWMLGDVVCQEFEKVAGRHQSETGKAMHVGFVMTVSGCSDQYRTRHMYLYAPGNYVYVALQEERVDRRGDRKVGPMELVCYHDSCWRDSVKKFLFDNRGELNGFSSFGHMFEWYDALVLSEDERKYLRTLDEARREDGAVAVLNPFDKRSIWRSLVR